MSCGHMITSPRDLSFTDNNISSNEDECTSQCEECDTLDLDDTVGDCKEALELLKFCGEDILRVSSGY